VSMIEQSGHDRLTSIQADNRPLCTPCQAHRTNPPLGAKHRVVCTSPKSPQQRMPLAALDGPAKAGTV